MNLVRIGAKTFNLSLVMRYEENVDPDMPSGSRRLELVFVNGATAALEGEDAEAMRRYLVSNSTAIALNVEEGEFSAERSMSLQAHGREKVT